MGENDALKDMAAQLAAMLLGGKRWKAWSQLHGKLAEVAAAVADPTTKDEALQSILKEAGDVSLDFGDSDAEALLRQIITIFQERARDVSETNPQLKDLVLLIADQLNMIPLGESNPVLMIDDDSYFLEEHVNDIVKCSAELSAPNTPYAVVSIIGAQSSGKSYLLNRLFGTKFPEMDAKLGRTKTTVGIMMTRCIGPSLLLLDIEGFDGVKPTEDISFENRAALFALTISDVMIVNMSVFDIGREQGGNATLFRTIFKERTKLPPGLTRILVVLRFYDGETPLEILSDHVMISLQKVWRSVNVESMKFSDYIQVEVVGLPDKNSPEFPKEVIALRKLLVDKTHRNRSAKVPASSFSDSSRLFWEAIKENRELDIPSHQVAIARLYCQRLVGETLNSIDSHEDYKLLKSEESPQRFGEISDALLKSITIKYDEETTMYSPDVRDMERQYLVQKLNEIFTEDCRELIWKMQKSTSKKFKVKFDKGLENMEESDAHQRVTTCVETFMSSCECLKAFDSDYFQRICGLLTEQLDSYISNKILANKEQRSRKDHEKLKTNVTIALGTILAAVTTFATKFATTKRRS